MRLGEPRTPHRPVTWGVEAMFPNSQLRVGICVRECVRMYMLVYAYVHEQVCMCVHMHAYDYVYAHVCICVSPSEYVDARLCANTRACVCTCASVCTAVVARLHACVHACTHVCVYICICVCAHACVQWTCTSVCVRLCVCVLVCVYAHTCEFFVYSLGQSRGPWRFEVAGEVDAKTGLVKAAGLGLGLPSTHPVCSDPGSFGSLHSAKSRSAG